MQLVLLSLTQNQLVGLLVGGGMLAVLCNVLLLRQFRHFKARPVPEGQVRWSTQSKPAVGGVGFAVALLWGILWTAFVPMMWYTALLWPLIAGAILAFGVGLVDDFRHVSPRIKFAMQLACAAAVVFSGNGIDSLGSDALNMTVSVVWIVGLMNAVNMLDNMDGITAVTSLFSTGFLLMSAAFMGGGGEAVCLAALMAGIFGFLLFNWHPSKMYMGDGGSQLLGFTLAVGSILFGWNIPSEGAPFTWTTMLVPLLVMAMPLTDTAVVILNRLSHGVSPAQGGRDHTTHNLSYLGMRDNMVAVTYSFLGAINLTWAVWIAYAEASRIVILAATVWGFLVFLAFFFISRYNLRRGKYSYSNA